MNTENLEQKYLIEEYTARINRVMDYIEQNIEKNFTLDELSKVANFSKFHFHRIFNSLEGETLFHFIQRLRVEKAASLLLNNPKESITDIAIDCGFSSSATFARSFKDHFKMSASEWRKTKKQNESNMGKIKSNSSKMATNQSKELLSSSTSINYKDKSQIWRITMENEEHLVEVKELSEMTVAYIRYTGPYKGNAQLFEELSNKLFKWAGPRNLLNFPKTWFLIIYHDDPDITGEEKLRLSVCITVPEETEVDGEIGKMVIPAGKYAMAKFELKADEYEGAWNWVYGSWLPKSGYVPDKRPAFELYPFDGEAKPKEKNRVDICIPVKPL